MNKLVSCFLRGRSKLTVQIVKEAWVDALRCFKICYKNVVETRER